MWARRAGLAGLAVAFALAACTRTDWRAELRPPARAAELPKEAPFLKVHTRAGHVYVLEHWRTDSERQLVHGSGIHYDERRHVIAHGSFDVPYSDIALLETNAPREVTNVGVAVLGVMGTLSLTASVLCLSNPKACFGSCPTFYVENDGVPTLQAEGFSESVLKALEHTDVDHLFFANARGRRLAVEMRNEALETHAVRSVELLAAERPLGSRVFRAGGEFWVASAVAQPTLCRAAGSDCARAVLDADESEWSSLADDHDLAAKETVELTFPARSGPRGLVLRARNTLLNTFLFYQLLSYAGRDAGDWISRLERGASEGVAPLLDFGRLLGGIQVQIELPERGWVDAGEFWEVGPIARETQLVLLPQQPSTGELHVRLILTRGNWKIDWAALATLSGKSRTTRSSPVRVLRDGRPDEAAAQRLRAPADYLITFPGDSYGLEFELPSDEVELFLESRGYYYEWIRPQWLGEEDSLALLGLFVAPRATLRRLAPAYKRVEGNMEELFWQSRIRKVAP